MNKFLKSFLLILIFAGTLYVIYEYIASPVQITGDKVNGYKDGQTVLVMSTPIYDILSTIHKGDVIYFQKNPGQIGKIAEVRTLGGQVTDQDIFNFDDENQGRTVPNEALVVVFDNSPKFVLVPKENIIGIVWLGL